MIRAGLGIEDFVRFVALMEASLCPMPGALKPHPDLFLHVAERLGVAPAACVVLEGHPRGVVADRGDAPADRRARLSAGPQIA